MTRGAGEAPAHLRLDSAPTGARDNQTTRYDPASAGSFFSGGSLGQGKVKWTTQKSLTAVRSVTFD